MLKRFEGVYIPFQTQSPQVNDVAAKSIIISINTGKIDNNNNNNNNNNSNNNGDNEDKRERAVGAFVALTLGRYSSE